MEIVVIDNGFVLCFSGAHGTHILRKIKEKKRESMYLKYVCISHLGVVQCTGCFSDSLKLLSSWRFYGISVHVFKIKNLCFFIVFVAKIKIRNRVAQDMRDRHRVAAQCPRARNLITLNNVDYL